jgi:hypothetical protein
VLSPRKTIQKIAQVRPGARAQIETTHRAPCTDGVCDATDKWL